MKRRLAAVEAGTKRILRSLARRYQHLSAEVRALEQILTALPM